MTRLLSSSATSSGRMLSSSRWVRACSSSTWSSAASAQLSKSRTMKKTINRVTGRGGRNRRGWRWKIGPDGSLSRLGGGADRGTCNGSVKPTRDFRSSGPSWVTRPSPDRSRAGSSCPLSSGATAPTGTITSGHGTPCLVFPCFPARSLGTMSSASAVGDPSTRVSSDRPPQPSGHPRATDP